MSNPQSDINYTTLLKMEAREFSILYKTSSSEKLVLELIHNHINKGVTKDNFKSFNLMSFLNLNDVKLNSIAQMTKKRVVIAKELQLKIRNKNIQIVNRLKPFFVEEYSEAKKETPTPHFSTEIKLKDYIRLYETTTNERYVLGLIVRKSIDDYCLEDLLDGTFKECDINKFLSLTEGELILFPKMTEQMLTQAIALQEKISKQEVKYLDVPNDIDFRTLPEPSSNEGSIEESIDIAINRVKGSCFKRKSVPTDNECDEQLGTTTPENSIVHGSLMEIKLTDFCSLYKVTQQEKTVINLFLRWVSDCCTNHFSQRFIDCKMGIFTSLSEQVLKAIPNMGNKKLKMTIEFQEKVKSNNLKPLEIRLNNLKPLNAEAFIHSSLLAEEKCTIGQSYLINSLNKKENKLITLLEVVTSTNLSVERFLTFSDIDIICLKATSNKNRLQLIALRDKLLRKLVRDHEWKHKETLDKLHINIKYKKIFKRDLELVSCVASLLNKDIYKVSVLDLFMIKNKLTGDIKGYKKSEICKEFLCLIKHEVDLVNEQTNYYEYNSRAGQYTKLTTPLITTMNNLDFALSQGLSLISEGSDERFKVIFKYRLGLNHTRTKTLEVISREYMGNISKERVRQLELSFLKKFTIGIGATRESIWEIVKNDFRQHQLDKLPLTSEFFYNKATLSSFVERLCGQKTSSVSNKI